MLTQKTKWVASHQNSRLQNEWLFLHDVFPPSQWRRLPNRSDVSSWLGVHQSLRKGQDSLEYLNRAYLKQKISWEEYQQQVAYKGYLHYGHLDGHHRNEDAYQFPRMIQKYPQLNHGFELLDKDHKQIHQQLDDIQVLLENIKNQVSENKDTANALYDKILENGKLLFVHLMDEEDLVMPILAIEENYIKYKD